MFKSESNSFRKSIGKYRGLKKTVDKYVEKDLPLLPALEDIEETSHKMKLGIQKTTNTVTLGRKLTKAWCKRQLLYGLFGSVAVSFGFANIFFAFYEVDMSVRIMTLILLSAVIELFFIAAAFRQTAATVLDNSMDQSIEFLNDGIRYYKFSGYWNNLKYFMAVLFGKEEKAVHYCRYEDVESVEILANKRYMSVESPIAYEVYVADFVFTFKNEEKFYFFWPMILDDDAKYIAAILKGKIKNIKDTNHILYAFQKGINLNDYLMNE